MFFLGCLWGVGAWLGQAPPHEFQLPFQGLVFLAHWLVLEVLSSAYD